MGAHLGFACRYRIEGISVDLDWSEQNCETDGLVPLWNRPVYGAQRV